MKNQRSHLVLSELVQRSGVGAVWLDPERSTGLVFCPFHHSVCPRCSTFRLGSAGPSVKSCLVVSLLTAQRIVEPPLSNNSQCVLGGNDETLF